MAAAKMNLPVIEKGATYRQVDLFISATDTSTLDGLGGAIAGDTGLDNRLTTVEGQVNGKIGDLSTLSTVDKSSIVNAVIEVNTNVSIEKSRSIAAEGVLTADLAAEVLARDAAIAAATPSFPTLTSKPTTLAGYGITDAYTKTESDTRIQAVVGAAPEALDTLAEIAAQLASDGAAAGALTTTVSLKVDKVSGKGLSTEDFTTAEKTKLAGAAPLASPTFSGQVTLTNTSGYNLYASGSAPNYMAGGLGIGGVPTADTSLLNVKPLVGGLTSFATRATGIVQSTVTTDAQYYSAVGQTAAAAFTLANLRGFYYRQSAIGAGSTLTAQFGFFVESDAIGATNNRAFCGVVPSGTGRYNLYMSGSAANYLAGDLQLGKVITPSGTNGAQTIDTTTGSVNFAIAATSLVVTNSLVTANSVIIVTVAANDTTMKSVQVVAAAGSFTIYANAAATAATRVNFLITN